MWYLWRRRLVAFIGEVSPCFLKVSGRKFLSMRDSASPSGFVERSQLRSALREYDTNVIEPSPPVAFSSQPMWSRLCCERSDLCLNAFVAPDASISLDHIVYGLIGRLQRGVLVNRSCGPRFSTSSPNGDPPNAALFP